MTIRCEQTEDLIITDLSETLPPDTAADLAAHIEQCSQCAALKKEYAALFASIKQDAPPDPGPLFWRRYDDSLSGRFSPKKTPAHTSKNRWWALAASLAAMAALTGGLVWHEGFPEQRVSARNIAAMETLAQVFGPTPEESGIDPALSFKLAVGQDEDAMVPWFEIEDDHSLL